MLSANGLISAVGENTGAVLSPRCESVRAWPRSLAAADSVDPEADNEQAPET